MKPLSTKELNLYEEDKSLDEVDYGPLIPLSDHLHELRNKIILSLVVLSITILIGFYFSRNCVKLLTEIAPVGTTFLQIKPGEFFFICLRVSMYLGIVLASPLIIWLLGSFIMPGLKENEKTVAIPILTGTPFLFTIGSIFAYFFVAPSMLNFLFGFGKDVISTSISIESYVSFTLLIIALCGCAFLLPIIIFALANIGLVNSKILIKKWRYAVLGSVILGAVLTPTPDPFNMTIVGSILISLYFFSCGILKIIKK